MGHSLESVFNPRSIAIIGASEVPGKAGERRTRSLVEGGFEGKIYPINPKRDRIFGHKAYPDITAIDGTVDLVMIVVPAPLIPEAVAGSVEKGAKGIVIITAGMGETGAEGKKIEAGILRIAREGGVHVIGPNCSGMFSGTASMNLLGIPNIGKGRISVLAQSGNIIDSLTYYAKVKGGGFSRIISAGNAIGVKFHQYIEYLGEDPDTDVIVMYTEGIKEGNEFVRVAREVTKKKPIVALKAGRSGAGSRAVASHTGSLAADDVVVDAAFRQAGIIRVSNPDELFDIAKTLVDCPPAKGKRVAILSEGGGDNSVAADNAERYGLDVPVLSKETQEKMRPFLLKGMPAGNPVDYGGTAEENPHMITECCKVCFEDDSVDGIFLTGFFGGFRDIIAPHVGEREEQTARELAGLVRSCGKPLMINTSFANAPYATLKILKESGIPVFDGPERVAQCLSALMHYYANQGKRKGQDPPRPGANARPIVREILRKAKDQGRTSLLETESRVLLQEHGLSLLPAELARTPLEAARSARKVGLPVALKVVSRDILHKSDAGGVKLNLATEKEVTEAFEVIMENAKKVTDLSRVEGAMVTPMAAGGRECIVGMTTDATFGPVLMFGLGGIFVEVLRDLAFRVAPLTAEDIDGMIKEIKGCKVLTGVRGERPKDVEAVKEVIRKVSELALSYPEIREIDLNPVIVHEKGVSIVDSRVIIG